MLRPSCRPYLTLQTNLALDALWICFTGALYTLCGWAPQASLACDPQTTWRQFSKPLAPLLLLLPPLALDSCITGYHRTGLRSTIDASPFHYWLSRHISYPTRGPGVGFESPPDPTLRVWVTPRPGPGPGVIHTEHIEKKACARDLITNSEALFRSILHIVNVLHDSASELKKGSYARRNAKWISHGGVNQYIGKKLHLVGRKEEFYLVLFCLMNVRHVIVGIRGTIDSVS